MTKINLADLLRTVARAYPDKDAIIDEGRAYRYRDLDFIVDRTASHLLDLGARPGSIVGLCLYDNADHLITMFAVWRIDATAIAMDWRSQGAEREAMVKRYNIALVLEHRSAGDSTIYRRVSVDDSWHEAVARAALLGPFQRTPGRVAYFNLSSGTTGTPSAIPMAHNDIFARCTVSLPSLRWGFETRYLSLLPFQFSVGRAYAIHTLLSGGTIFIAGPLIGAEELLESVNRYLPTHVALVPPMARTLLALSALSYPLISDVPFVICTGAPLRPDEKREALDRVSGQFHVSYGAASGGLISILFPEQIAAHADTVGRPALYVCVEIVDGDDRPVQPGDIGTLRFLPAEALLSRSDAAAPNTNLDMIRNGWHYPGDLAQIDEDGFIHLIGRTADVINRGGGNIYPAEIENALQSHSAVAEAAAVAWPSPLLGEETAAFVVARGTVSKQELMILCRGVLSPAKQPRDIFFVDALPRNPNGKVLKHKLQSRLPSICD